MESPPAAAAAAHPTAPARQRWSLGRVAVVVTLLVLAAMWGYVLFLGSAKPVDTLDDRAFAAAAEPACAAAVATIDSLPPAEDSPDAAARAVVVDQANADLRAMIGTLRAIATTDQHDADLVGRWLDDWDTYIGDRQVFADSLRTDPKARFYETARSGGEQISAAIDNLAGVNQMASCATPGDV